MQTVAAEDQRHLKKEKNAHPACVSPTESSLPLTLRTWNRTCSYVPFQGISLTCFKCRSLENPWEGQIHQNSLPYPERYSSTTERFHFPSFTRCFTESISGEKKRLFPSKILKSIKFFLFFSFLPECSGKAPPSPSPKQIKQSGFVCLCREDAYTECLPLPWDRCWYFILGGSCQERKGFFKNLSDLSTGSLQAKDVYSNEEFHYLPHDTVQNSGWISEQGGISGPPPIQNYMITWFSICGPLH